MVKLGRMITGKPICSATERASSKVVAYPLRGMSTPMRFMASLKSCRSSAFSMASREAPMSSTPWRASAPFRASATARLRAVCPPRVGSRTSGFSRARICSATSGVMGST